MHDVPPVNRDRAEWIAIAVLGTIAKQPDRLSQFLTLTGIEPMAIRALAEDPRFLAGVVDYVADDPSLAAIIISELALHPADLSMAQYALRNPKPRRAALPDRLPMPPRRIQ